MKQHRTILLASSIVLTFLVIATATYPTWLIRRAAAATSAPAATTAPVPRSVGDQTRFSAEAIAQERSVPVLTLQNAPDVPQCHEILNQEILDLVNSASEDPAETFEQNRRAHPHMIMIPAPLDCASKLWLAARKADRAQESGISSELLSLRQSSIENFFNLSALNASVGTNIDLADGVEGYQGTNSISIDPNNSLHLTAASNTFYKDPTATCQSPTGGTANTYGTIALFGSTDGGATWTYNCAPWPATITGGVTGATFWFGSYPTLAWDNQGRAYATYMLLSQSASAYGAAIVVARSSDDGASWQSLGTVVNGIASTTQGNDKEMMAIDNTSGQTFSHSGRLYVIWQAANAEKIAFSDNGTAWTTVNFPSNTGAGGGNVVVGADGTVYVIWSRYNVETIVFSKSTDGGATWTAPQVIATLALQSYGTNNKPPAQDKRGINGFGAIDVDRNPNSAFFGNLYVSFTDFPSGTTAGADTNAYVIRSTNGGTSWSSRVKVNDDNFGATQMFPWLAVDQSDGTVNASWYDTRLDPLNRQTQMVSSRSVDGGASFEPNVLVSDGGSAWRNNVNYSDENSADNPAYNSNQYGDYSGLAALNRQVHPFWADSRMFFPVADTQSPTRREDNATSVLTYCSAPAAIAVPIVNPSTAPNVAVSWSAPAGWGTNATNGTYSVFRDTSSVFPAGSPLASDLTSTSYVDTTGDSGTTYYYFIRAKNNCPGTALTPMSTDSPASGAVVFGSTGTATGKLQGTLMAGDSAVSGVIVSAGPLSATTNASGFYLFSAISAATYTVSASPGGYNPVSISGVVVTDGGTTVQNLSLTPITSGSCFTDTTFADFSPGTGSNVDIAGSPGNVKLRNLGVQASDQVSSPAALSTTNNLSATTWTGQTFRAGVTGNLTRMDIGLGLASGSSGTITVEIRNLNGINPGATVLATTTIGPVTNVGSAALYTTTFATPAAVVSGTSYSIVLRTSVGSTVFGVRGSTAGGSTLANGQVFTTTTSGATWTPVAADLNFTSYVTPPLTYTTSGNLISAAKDSNPVVSLVPRWLTLSWNASTPANTVVQFQVAASNSINGPFNFVGPDGTTTTFFTTSGASLSQFNGFRYLKYEALLSTTDNVVSPTLNDVTVCFDNDTPMIAAASPFSIQQGAAGNAQIATVSDPGQVANTLNVTATPLAGTGVTIDSISVDVAGNVTANVAAICAATNSTFTLTVTNSGSATATATLTINVSAIDTPVITPGGPTTFCEGGSVTLTSSTASGNQWYLNGNPIGGATNQEYIAIASGDYTVTETANSCTSTSSSAAAVIVNPLPATPTITPDGPTTFCEGGSVTLTSSNATGNQWYLNGNLIGGASAQTYPATASGDYTVVVTDTNNCLSAPSTATSVTVNPIPATPIITPGPMTFCEGGSVTLTSSSATGSQWFLNGNPIGGATNQAYIATASGDYTNTVSDLGCTSAPSSATTVIVNPIPATPTITPDGPTTFCAGGNVTLTSSNASGNQWYLNGNSIGGATNQEYIATASGDYTNIFTAFGCSSSPSAATAVTVNPIPGIPTITPSVETTLCPAGDVTLTSSSASGNQWYLDGNPIGGATNQQYMATVAGDYTVTATTSGCTSAASAATTLTPNVALVLTYASPQSVSFAGSLDLSPTTASSSITDYVLLSVVPALTTPPTVAASGVVSITHGQPTGSHVVTIRATDSCSVTVDASFTLNVTLTTTYSDPSGNCGGNTPCFTTIQAAINALTVPGTVNVSGGTFNEDVNVSSNTTLNIHDDTTVNSMTLSGGTLNGSNGGSFTLTLAAGNWSNDGGTFDRGTGSVSFTGTAQNIGGTNLTTFNNLMVGAGGTTVAVDQTVAGVLTLTGDVTVNSPAKLIMLASASSTGAGDVIGSLQRLGFVSGACVSAPCVNTLSVGNPNNQITITNGVAPTSVLINLAKSAPETYGAAVQRNYTITETGGSGFTITLRLHYLDSELNGNTPESNLNLRRFNGSAWPAILRSVPVNTTDNWVESNAVTGFSQWTFASLAPTATSASISGQILSDSGLPVAGAVMRMSGTQNRKTITDANGNYDFENVEAGGFYSVTPSLLSHHFSPEVRSFSQLGINTSALFMATRDAVIAGNAIDTPEYFVRQHYLDFLGREPDESGFNFWSNQIVSCGTDAACVERRAINVSAAYFLSIEFQQTGGLVDGLYRVSYGRAPDYTEFMPDTSTLAHDVVVGHADWAQTLEANKREFIAAWVLRAEFQSVYRVLSNEGYVNTLISHTGTEFLQSEHDALVNGLNIGTSTRAEVLQEIAENDGFITAKRNAAFVRMEYFGYLRRDPDETGYEFWLNKLSEFNGDFERAEMVKAFLVSSEYRERFRLTP
jgi:hypothetical protein